MAQIFVPYTEVQPLTKAALRHYDYTAVLMRHKDSYSNLLESLWEASEDFIIVEHDVVFWEGCIEQLEHCSEAWCVFVRDGDMRLMSTRIPTLCLTRFRKELLKEHSTNWEAQRRAREEPSWQYCDVWINDSLTSVGVEPHWHEPAVVNLRQSMLLGKNSIEFPTSNGFEHFRQSVI